MRWREGGEFAEPYTNLPNLFVAGSSAGAGVLTRFFLNNVGAPLIASFNGDVRTPYVNAQQELRI